MGEIRHCKILFEKDNIVTELKQMVDPFSKTYKTSVINKFLCEAEFSSMCGRKSIARHDIIYASGSLYRCINCLIQVLYAQNNEYLLNEKGSLKRLAYFKLIPVGFIEDSQKIFTELNPETISKAFDIIDIYINQIRNIDCISSKLKCTIQA